MAIIKTRKHSRQNKTIVKKHSMKKHSMKKHSMKKYLKKTMKGGANGVKVAKQEHTKKSWFRRKPTKVQEQSPRVDVSKIESPLVFASPAEQRYGGDFYLTQNSSNPGRFFSIPAKKMVAKNITYKNTTQPYWQHWKNRLDIAEAQRMFGPLKLSPEDQIRVQLEVAEEKKKAKEEKKQAKLEAAEEKKTAKLEAAEQKIAAKLEAAQKKTPIVKPTVLNLETLPPTKPKDNPLYIQQQLLQFRNRMGTVRTPPETPTEDLTESRNRSKTMGWMTALPKDDKSTNYIKLPGTSSYEFDLPRFNESNYSTLTDPYSVQDASRPRLDSQESQYSQISNISSGSSGYSSGKEPIFEIPQNLKAPNLYAIRGLPPSSARPLPPPPPVEPEKNNRNKFINSQQIVYMSNSPGQESLYSTANAQNAPNEPIYAQVKKRAKNYR